MQCTMYRAKLDVRKYVQRREFKCNMRQGDQFLELKGFSHTMRSKISFETSFPCSWLIDSLSQTLKPNIFLVANLCLEINIEACKSVYIRFTPITPVHSLVEAITTVASLFWSPPLWLEGSSNRPSPISTSLTISAAWSGPAPEPLPCDFFHLRAMS